MHVLFKLAYLQLFGFYGQVSLEGPQLLLQVLNSLDEKADRIGDFFVGRKVLRRNFVVGEDT